MFCSSKSFNNYCRGRNRILLNYKDIKSAAASFNSTAESPAAAQFVTATDIADYDSNAAWTYVATTAAACLTSCMWYKALC